MLTKVNALDIIKALRPLLENTPISPTDKNWKKIYKTRKSDGDFIKTYMDDLGSRMQWVTCPECSREWNNLTEAGICAQCQDTKRDFDRRQTESGDYLPRAIGRFGLARYSFQTFKIHDDNQVAYEACSTFDPKTQNIYLHGLCGVGKTHLAGALLKKAAAEGRTIKWVTPIYLGRGLRSRFANQEEEFIDSVAYADVLIIDDLGVGRDAHAILQAAYEIMEKRRNREQHGLVVTSNLNLDELTKKYGDDRLSSRVAGMCRVVSIKGDDWRIKKELDEEIKVLEPVVKAEQQEELL